MKKGLLVFSSIAAGVGTAAAGGITYFKKKGICPRCEVKKAVSKLQRNYVNETPYNNGTCLTPPMGWSSWNCFRNKINENVILDIAKAVKESGLAEAGYVYVNIDDCWQSSMRDENGKLQGDLGTFPHGIKWLVNEVNSLGLKFGIYSSNGTLTCEDLPASLNNERIDADTFAEWGVEYFKYDYCHNVALPSAAPYIDSIVISGNGIDSELAYRASDAALSGEATAVVEDNGNSYVKGLCSGIGTVTFNNIEVLKDGKYVFTIVMKKYDSDAKYCVATVNGTDKYEILIPENKAFSREGRHQIIITLKEGKNIISLTNPVGSEMDSAAILYERMGKELKRATKEYAEKNNCDEKKIVFSICEWGKNRPWKWGGSAGNVWRTTPDIFPNWASIAGIYEVNVRLNKYARPGAFNDPDMLEVGNGKLTVEENKSHFTLWAMMAAPLILGNDIRTFIKPDGTVDKDNKILKILTNKDIIAIDQDELGIQCSRVKTNVLTDILVKPLSKNEVALCFFNKGLGKANMSYTVEEICNLTNVTLPKASKYICKELWSGETIETDNVISAQVPSHGVAVWRISALTE
ncbi:MAG: alpha-galactosidase [Oscillospiraceae bacterium]|nr:alpha-galactosidase [Oscillospiraceae bacterium]